jgi:hypothetical protein
MGKIRAINKMPQFVADVDRRAARAVTQALILGASEASVLTPIDTSTLLNSQYRSVERQGGTIKGTVGYTAAYAMPVHDPENPQKFRRASAEKEFLKKGFERQRKNIDAAVRGTLRTK